MPTDIVIPALGESITSGVIANWRKKDGERVERDETLLELETDKITLELPSPAAGVLSRRAAEGDTVDVGAVVGVIEEKPGAATGVSAPAAVSVPTEPRAQARVEQPPAPAPSQPARATPSPAVPPTPAAPAAPARATPSEPGAAATGATAPTGQRPAQGSPAPDVRATPLAKKTAEDKGLDLSRITPTGPGGRVSEHDVLAAAGAPRPGSGAVAPVAAAPGSEGARVSSPAASSPPAPAPSGARATSRERVSPLRAKIAARLVEAQHTAAMLTTFNECDMSAVMDLRARHKEAFEKKHGVGLGFMSFFVKAAVSALEAYPLVNAQLSEDAEGRLEILKHHYCDIAVAVGTPKGLTVPVLRNCETLSFAQIENGIKDLASRAKDGKLTLDDLQGGTFTITNGGIYGSMMSTPILNPPQSAILGMHNIMRRAVENPVKPGSGEVVIRPMMYLALSYDHRIIDGAEAVSFLVHIKKAIENPERLLLGM